MHIDPVVTVEVLATNVPKIYQPLILQCTTTIASYVTGTVDIIWTTGDTQVRRVNNVTASSNIDSTSVYNDTFTTPSLNISYIGSTYQCEVLINSNLVTEARKKYFIPIPGMYSVLYYYPFCMLHMVIPNVNVLYTGSRCSGSLAQDVVFVIDSRIIYRSVFYLAKEFVANITADLLIRNSPRSAFGMILFERDAHIEFNLQAYTNLNTLLSAINELSLSGAAGDVPEALRYLISTTQNGTLRFRHSTSKVVIFIISEGYRYRSAVLSISTTLHSLNMFDVFAIGEAADGYNLQAIASRPDYAFTLRRTTDLEQIKDRILSQLCNCKSAAM